MSIAPGNIGTLVGQKLADLVKVELAAACQKDRVMVPQAVKRPEGFGKASLLFDPINRATLHPLLSMDSGENIAVILPGWRGPCCVTISFCPADLLILKEG